MGRGSVFPCCLLGFSSLWPQNMNILWKFFRGDCPFQMMIERLCSVGLSLGICKSYPILAARRAKKTAGLVLVFRARGMWTSCAECSKNLSRFTQLSSHNLQRVMFYDRGSGGGRQHICLTLYYLPTAIAELSVASGNWLKCGWGWWCWCG